MTAPTPPPAPCPPLIVPGPEPAPYRYGLLSAAEIRDVAGDPHWQCGVEYEPAACGPANIWTSGCPRPDPVPTKTATDWPGMVDGTPVTVYALTNCSLVGQSVADAERRVRQILALGEQRAVERAFWTGEAGNQPHLADPDCTVLNTVPGAEGALSLLAGVAALESWLGDLYGGVGVLHGPRGVAPFASYFQLLVRDGGRLATPVGTRWALGGGYVVNTGPDGTTAPEGTAWLYATGAVTVWRSDVFVNPPGGVDGFDPRTNELVVVAERTYVLTRECVCAAVLVSTSCTC